MSLEAVIALQDGAASPVGRERIRLLQAVAREGSISAGARAAGMSYRAAWDALDAMSNLFGAPLLATRSGGAVGGGAALTPAGRKVIEAYGRLEAEMARVVRALGPDLEGTGVSPLNLMSGFLMRTSARNALRGTIESLRSDTINAEIGVRVSPESVIHAQVTNQSARDLGLVVGREAVVLIKAPFVMIAEGDGENRTSARNSIAGSVLRCDISDIAAEVIVDIGGGKTLAAVISAQSAKSLRVRAGARVRALFDSTHVVVAID